MVAMVDPATLQWADYVLMVPFVILTAFVGPIVFFADWAMDRESGHSLKHFFRAGSQMNGGLTAISLLGTLVSPVYLVAAPTECYYFSILYAYILVSYFVSFPLYGRLVLPTLLELDVSTVYEVCGSS